MTLPVDVEPTTPERLIDGGFTAIPTAVSASERNSAKLVGIAEIEGHRGGQELGRVVRLEIGGLVGDQRVGRGVALVEAVFGEALAAGRRSRPPATRSMPRSVAPLTKCLRCACISVRIFLPMARRSRSAWPSE